MTRKDYVLIAKALSDARPPDGDTVGAKLAWLACVTTISHRLMQANAPFKPERFLDACRATSLQGFEVSL